MKTVNIELSKDLEYIEVHTFADWHIGDCSAKLDEIKTELEYIKNNPNAYIICNGDLLNNATKTSISDCYAEELPPMDAMNRLLILLEPVKDKILMMTQGNHEARSYKNDGIDLTEIVAQQLGIYDRYCKEGGVLFLRLGWNASRSRKHWYTIYATHGSGGGRKEGAKAIRLADMAAIVDTDIYIHSHTHLPMVMKQSFYRVSGQNSSVALTEKLFVNTSARLGYGGYGQTYEFKPSSTSNPVIFLSGSKKYYTATL